MNLTDVPPSADTANVENESDEARSLSFAETDQKIDRFPMGGTFFAANNTYSIGIREQMKLCVGMWISADKEAELRSGKFKLIAENFAGPRTQCGPGDWLFFPRIPTTEEAFDESVLTHDDFDKLTNPDRLKTFFTWKGKLGA